MSKVRIPLLLFLSPKRHRFLKRMRNIGRALLPLFPSLPPTLKKVRIEAEPETYIAASLLSSFTYGVGSGLGWFLAILAMAGIRQKIARARIPRGLEGAGITLIITGMMALAFIGFTGMIKI